MEVEIFGKISKEKCANKEESVQIHSCSRQNTPATAGSRSLLNFNIFVFLFCCICGYSDEPSHRDAVPPPSTFSVETAHNYSTSMQG